MYFIFRNPCSISYTQPLIKLSKLFIYSGESNSPVVAAATDNGTGATTATPATAPTNYYQNTPRAPLDSIYIRSLVWQQKKQLAIGAVCLLICVASNLASPVISGLLFETLVQNKPFENYSKLLGIMLAIYIIEPLLSQVYIKQVCAVGEKVQASLRLEAFRIVLMQKIEFFDRHRASEITNLLSKDLEALRTFVFANVSRDRGFRALAEALGSVLVLFWLSWRLGPIMAGVIIATAAIAWLYRRQSRVFEQASAQAQARMAACVDETVSQVRTVRIFAGEPLERERYASVVMDAYHSGMGFSRAKALLECLNRGAIHASLLALYAFGGYLVNQKLIPLRILLSAIGFTFSLIFATQGLLQSWTDARQAKAALNRVQKVLSEMKTDESMAESLPPGAWWDVANEYLQEDSCPAFTSEDGEEVDTVEEEEKITAVEAARRGEICVSNLNFSYPARPAVKVIDNLSLTLPRGKVTALVGRSGAGKSTVASLLERLYQPDSGDITLNGIPIQKISRNGWVDCVTGLTQEPVLFNGTIYDNIAYGKTHATAEEVERAAKAANAHEFIVNLPAGYESVVGERGGLLSGGQRQRIALARALLKDAPILILDEATSHLDTESERLVQQAIDNLVEGRTVLVIAHRLSTVQSAGQILVMEDGQVKESGTHAELAAIKGGRYAKLVSSQALTLSAS
jgi:ATP-binding cassette subfamily B (MDR/TAP) protein 10